MTTRLSLSATTTWLITPAATGPRNPGTFDYAVIFGNNDTALAGGDAAGAGSYDGAYVEGDNLGIAHAQGSDYLADILKFYGDGSTHHRCGRKRQPPERPVVGQLGRSRRRQQPLD